MVIVYEARNQEEFYRLAYDQAIATKEKFNIYAGCTISNRASERTISLRLSFDSPNGLIEYTEIIMEDRDDITERDADKKTTETNTKFKEITDYLTNKERPKKVNITRKNGYLIIDSSQNLEAQLRS